jgi:hypothetical protein
VIPLLQLKLAHVGEPWWYTIDRHGYKSWHIVSIVLLENCKGVGTAVVLTFGPLRFSLAWQP